MSTGPLILGEMSCQGRGREGEMGGGRDAMEWKLL